MDSIPINSKRRSRTTPWGETVRRTTASCSVHEVSVASSADIAKINFESCCCASLIISFWISASIHSNISRWAVLLMYVAFFLWFFRWFDNAVFPCLAANFTISLKLPMFTVLSEMSLSPSLSESESVGTPLSLWALIAKPRLTHSSMHSISPLMMARFFSASTLFCSDMSSVIDFFLFSCTVLNASRLPWNTNIVYN